VTIADASKRLDGLAEAEALAAFLRCCGSRRWAEAMARARPYGDAPALLAAAERAFAPLQHADWLEAFSHHPRIGDRGALAAGWSAAEQSSVDGAAQDVVGALVRANRDYEARFGYIFIVCATGKSAAEMLALLQGRLANGPDAELEIATAEQRKITAIRLKKLLSEGP